jgi:hypothetical protein
MIYLFILLYCVVAFGCSVILNCFLTISSGKRISAKSVFVDFLLFPYSVYKFFK